MGVQGDQGEDVIEGEGKEDEGKEGEVAYLEILKSATLLS